MRERLMVSVGLLLCSLLLLVTPVAADSPYVGEVRIWAGSTAPDGWEICDGEVLSRSGYADLFSVIGTTYGYTTDFTFRLPNLKGRQVVGLSDIDTEFDTLGESGGEKRHTLTIAEMPSHTHLQDPHTHTVNMKAGANTSTTYLGRSGDGGLVNLNTGSTTATNQYTGGSGSHNVLDPYLTMNFIIYTGVGLPTATPTATPTSTPTGTITPTPTATATPGAGGSGPITGTITGSIIITQSLPANAFTTTMTTGNELVWLRSASYGEIIAGSGGLMGFVALLYVAVLHFSRRPQ